MNAVTARRVAPPGRGALKEVAPVDGATVPTLLNADAPGARASTAKASPVPADASPMLSVRSHPSTTAWTDGMASA